MPTTFSERLPISLMRLSYFAPAIIAFFATAFVPQPYSLITLLFADALMMVAVCRALGFSPERNFLADIMRRGLVYFVLLAAYAGLITILIGYPLAWLMREDSLSGALAVSGAGVIALIAMWRWWPLFGLIFVWKEVHPHDGRHPHTTDAIKRSFALAWNMTSANDLFFSHGFLVALCLATLAQGALSLAGIEGAIPENFRLIALAIYALLIAPFAHWLITTRCADALLIELRRSRYDRAQEAIKDVVVEPVEQSIEVMPEAGLSTDELNAMLIRCIRAGQTELALAALERGADPNFVCAADERDQRPPLVLAAVSPDMRLLRGLIVKGGDLNRSHAGLTPLLAATRDSHEGRPDAVMTLLTNGADPRCTDAAGNTPMHYAALAARPIVAALLCDAEAPLEAINREGLTPLGVACAAANWELARFLLERGAKIEVDHAQSALIAAASVDDDDEQGVKLLLKRRARVDATGPLARTALMVAALNANEVIVKTLLDAGAKIDLVDAHGATALMEAARSGAHAVIDAFAEHRPAVDMTDALGRTALIIASQSKQASEQIVSQLLALGASRDLAASDGRRAVDYAATAGRWNIVALLDPNYPRPANLAMGEVRESQSDATAHLLDALRFAHWNIVDNFTEQVRTWSLTDRTHLFAELADHVDPAPRHWLLNHGLDTESEGAALLDDVLSRLPATRNAFVDLCAAGVQIGGTDVLLRICAAITKFGDARAELEPLALAAIEQGAELFAPDGDSRAPLIHAIACGSGAIVTGMLERGVDPNVRDRHGRTPLFDALQLPSAVALELVKVLLSAGANPDASAASGETPLGLALARSEPELQNWLNWPTWKLPQRRLRSIDLVSAAASGDVQAVDKLLTLGLPIDATDAQGASPLLRAAGCGHAMLVQLLLSRGANSAQTAITGATALSAAVSARRDTVVETLLTHGVAADQRLLGGGTALMIASALGYPEIVAQLLAHGADVDAEDERGMRALHAAAQSAFQTRDVERSRRTLELLLERGASIDASNGAGQTALLLLLGARAEPGAGADQRQLLMLLPLLLHRRVDLNAQDKRGVTALHACAMHGLLLPAGAVLAAGADPERRDILDRTPSQIAHLLGFIDVAAEISASITPIIGVAQSARQPPRGLDSI
jgi:uncharacterized protein